MLLLSLLKGCGKVALAATNFQIFKFYYTNKYHRKRNKFKSKLITSKPNLKPLNLKIPPN